MRPAHHTCDYVALLLTTKANLFEANGELIYVLHSREFVWSLSLATGRLPPKAWNYQAMGGLLLLLARPKRGPVVDPHMVSEWRPATRE